MAQELSEVAAHGDFVAGGFVAVSDSAADGAIVRLSPRYSRDRVGRFAFRLAAVDEAVAAARAAWPDWSRCSVEARSAQLLTLKRVIAARADDFALLLAREIGKPLWEAKTEVAAALNKIDITLSDGLALIAARDMGSPTQRYAFKPHGVAAVLGPFNFPLHLVHGHVVPALVTGNTVVVKPSELAPAIGQLYAECFRDAGFPRGVFNLVQGDAAAGARLAAHPGVDAVLFTGSYAAGQAIKRATLEQPHKLVALEMGGRNPAIVLEDSDLDKAAHDVLWGAFVSAGQRCSGTAVALVAEACFDAFEALLLRKLDGIRVGDPFEPVFMGPLISPAARARFLEALVRAEGEGVMPLRASRALTLPLEGAYVAPSVHRVDEPGDRAYEREELFGPDLALEAVVDLDHAIARANASQYGLSASVFTNSEAAFEQAFAHLRYGCTNWNAPTCGASSRLPFGGTRKSGNHRPAALFSTLYATYPVASLKGASSLDPRTLSPGFEW